MSAATNTATIAHALFWYAKPDGTPGLARRGDTVDLSDEDYARGVEHDAFTVDDDAPVPAGELPEFPAEGSEAEHDNWAESANVEEILEYANAHPEQAAAILEAEGRGKNRKTAVEPLTALVEAAAQS